MTKLFDISENIVCRYYALKYHDRPGFQPQREAMNTLTNRIKNGVFDFLLVLGIIDG